MNPRSRINRQREATLARLDAVTAEFAQLVEAAEGSNTDDEHDPEGSTIAFERSQLDALILLSRSHLVELDAAARRLEEGTYGRCEGCDGEIAVDRLVARPTARRCIECAST